MLTVGRHILAKYLKLSPRRINQLVDEGILSKTGRGAYPFVDNLHAYFRYLKSQAPAGAFKYLDEEDTSIDDEPLLTETQMDQLEEDLRNPRERKANRS